VPLLARAGLVGFVSMLPVAAALPFVIEPEQAETGDGGVYVQAADDPTRFVQAPQSYRVLAPTIVWLLPGSEEWGFVALTLVCLGLSSALLYVLLLRFFDPSAATLGVALYVASGACASAAATPYLVDPLGFVFLLGGLLLLLEGRWWWAVAVVSSGVLAKESVLYLLLPAAVLVWIGRRRIGPAQIALFVVPVTVYLLIHRTPLLFHERVEPDLLDTVRSAWHTNDDPGHIRVLAKALAYSFAGAWVLVSLVARLRGPQLAVATLLVPASLSLLAASDWPRLLGWAFPAVALLVARARPGLQSATVLLTTLFVNAWWLGHGRDWEGKDVLAIALMLTGAAAALIALRQEDSVRGISRIDSSTDTRTRS
jgi:hypothetical protein